MADLICAKCSHRLAVAALLAMTSVGCTLLMPGTTPHVARDAEQQERKRCDAGPVDPRLYGPGIVEGAIPHYRYVMGGPNGKETHFAGAEIHLRPLPGVTAELLERGLMCRSAKLMLGHATPLPNERYFLPDGWVKIDVQSGGGSFAVLLIAEDDGHGREIYARAQEFANQAGAPQ
jgi:hypothetical protein